MMPNWQYAFGLIQTIFPVMTKRSFTALNHSSNIFL